MGTNQSGLDGLADPMQSVNAKRISLCWVIGFTEVEKSVNCRTSDKR